MIHKRVEEVRGEKNYLGVDIYTIQKEFMYFFK